MGDATRKRILSSNEEDVQRIITQVDERIASNEVGQLIAGAFRDWNKESLTVLIELANNSGRKYGDRETLLSQYDVLEERFRNTSAATNIKKWMMFFTKKHLYSEIPDILHLAICSFLKIPLEATAETIGSIINNHGSRNRSSLLPKSLSNEVQVNWNGPSEFSPEATSVIDEALITYFEGKQTGMRFFARTRLNIISSTIASYMKKPSRININP